MRKTLKKGFTIVELVIVIAVIAILAAVLIPTFSNIIRKANVSNDVQLVRNLNTALILDNKEHKTMQDALDAAEEGGFDVAKINSKISENKILWDSKNDVFCYLNGDKIEYVPNSVEESAKLDKDSYLLWIISNEVHSVYSTYLNGFEGTTVNATKGLDVGNTEGIKSISYVNNTSIQNVVIRTNSFETTLTITGYVDSNDNTKGDIITHYGYSGIVDIVKCAMGSYDETGTVGRINVAEGHVDIKANASVFQVKTSEGEGSAVSIDKDAIVYYNDGTKVEGEILKTDAEAQSKFEQDALANCDHDETEYVIDGNFMYEVCKSCGYTVVTVINNNSSTKMTVVDSNSNTVVIPVSTYTVDSSDVTVNGNNVQISDEAVPTVKTPEIDKGTVDLTCKHPEWTYVDNEDGKHKATCTSCNMTFIEEHTFNENRCTKCGYEQFVRKYWSDIETQMLSAPEGFTKDGSNITISSSNAFAWFAKNVNANTEGYRNSTVTIASNIDLLNYYWTPINNFAGTFDGGNYTISNVYVEGERTGDGFGLFGKSNAKEYKNVNIYNVYVVGNSALGALVGSSNAKIDNVHVSGHIEIGVNTSNGSIPNFNSSYVGGIIGYGYPKITNSSVCGDETSEITDGRQMGGILGFSGEGVSERVKNCTVKNIKISGKKSVGGIIGWAYGTGITNCLVENVVVEINGFAELETIGLISGSTIYHSTYAKTTTYKNNNVVNSKIIVNGQERDNGEIFNFYSYYGSTAYASNDNGIVIFYGDLESAIAEENEYDNIGLCLPSYTGYITIDEGRNVTIDLNGGTLYGDCYNVAITNNGTLLIKNGKLDGVTGNGNTTKENIEEYVVPTVATIIRNGVEVKYGSVGAAAADASDGEIVVVQMDTIESFEVKKNITIDLNGKTITGSSDYTIDNYAELTIIDSVGGGKVSGSSYTIYMNESNDVLNVESGIIESIDPAIGYYGAAIFCGQAGSKVNISGGFIKTTSSEWYHYDIDSRNNKFEISITGGSFSKDPNSLLGNGYVATQNEDGTWTVSTAE